MQLCIHSQDKRKCSCELLLDLTQLESFEPHSGRALLHSLLVWMDAELLFSQQVYLCAIGAGLEALNARSSPGLHVRDALKVEQVEFDLLLRMFTLLEIW